VFLAFFLKVLLTGYRTARQEAQIGLLAPYPFLLHCRRALVGAGFRTVKMFSCSLSLIPLIPSSRKVCTFAVRVAPLLGRSPPVSSGFRRESD